MPDGTITPPGQAHTFEITPGLDRKEVLFDFIGPGDIGDLLFFISCRLLAIGNGDPPRCIHAQRVGAENLVAAEGRGDLDAASSARCRAAAAPRAHARLRWPDRARLALLAGTLPIDWLAGMRLIVTPGTIMRRHRGILRRRWARLPRRGRPGRPAARRNARSVLLRLARENESRGYRRIHGELAGPGISVAPSTVWILKSAGIVPAPRRNGRPGRAEFPRSRARGILAPDFFTAGLLNGSKACVLAVIEHGTRRIRVLGATENPVRSWAVQQARNLLMDLGDAGMSVKFVLHDRDASFTAASGAVFGAAGARVVRSAIRASRMNSVMERWTCACRKSHPCRLSGMLVFVEDAARGGRVCRCGAGWQQSAEGTA